MASALLYIAAWSIITCLSIYFRGAVASDIDLRFNVEPRDAVVAKGSSVWLNCSASSELGLVNITWLKDGSPFYGSKRFKIYQSGSLLLKRVTAKRHEGQYSCLASDDFGTIRSTAAVQIAYLDAFTKEPTSVTSYTGEDVRFACSIHGNPTPAIQWRKGGHYVKASNHYVVLNSGVLQIFGVTPSDAGNYSCIANNTAGESVSIQAQLTVLSQGNELKPIEILSQSLNISTKEWMRAELECFATGNPKPTIEWLKDGKVLGRHIEHEKVNGNLVIRSTQPHHSGNYTCVASTETSTKSKSIQLKVLLPPFLEKIDPEEPWDRPTSSSVLFTCTFNGVPTPRVEWYHNGRLLKEADRIKIKNDGKLVIGQSRPSDSGYFQCWGINEAGVQKGTTTLRVLPPDSTAPDPPQIEECRLVSDNTIFLSWKAAPPKNGQGSSFYSVHYRTGDKRLQIVCSVTSCNISGLDENSEYFIFVMAYNEGGPSDHSETCTVITGPTHKVPNNTNPPTSELSEGMASPSNLKLAVVSPTSLNVSWDYKVSPNSVTGSATLQFRVRYQEDVLGLLNLDRRGEVIVTSRHTVLSDLKPNKRYQVEVRAESGSHIGGYSNIQMYFMPEAPPSAPRNLVYDRGNDWVSLRWEPPRDLNGVLESYMVSYCTDRGLPESQWERITEDGSVTETLVRGLKAGVAYHFKVAAATGGGIGPSTPTFTIQTTTSSSTGDRNKGIIVGVSIGVSCIIICIIIVLLRNKCCSSHTDHTTTISHHGYPHSNGSVPNGHGPVRGLVHHVDGSFQEMDSYQPMLSPHVPPNHDIDTKGGYDTYPRHFERVQLMKGMNGFSGGGRTRTVSSGYTSDRDLDQVDEGIPLTHQTMTVGTQSEHLDPISVDITRLGELEEDACSSGVPSSNLDSFSNHSCDHHHCHGGSFCNVANTAHPNTQMTTGNSNNTGSWSSTSRNSSNKDSGTGTECLMPDDDYDRGSSNTITLGEAYNGALVQRSTDNPIMRNRNEGGWQQVNNNSNSSHQPTLLQNTTSTSTSDGCPKGGASTTATKTPPQPQLTAFDSGEHLSRQNNTRVNTNDDHVATSNTKAGNDENSVNHRDHPSPLQAALPVNSHQSQQPPQPQRDATIPHHHQPPHPPSQNASSATRVNTRNDSRDWSSSTGDTSKQKNTETVDQDAVRLTDTTTTSSTAFQPSQTNSSRERDKKDDSSLPRDAIDAQEISVQKAILPTVQDSSAIHSRNQQLDDGRRSNGSYHGEGTNHHPPPYHHQPRSSSSSQGNKNNKQQQQQQQQGTNLAELTTQCHTDLSQPPRQQKL